VPLLIPRQRTDEWLIARRGKITASLAAAILGLDPWMGPLAVYNEICGISKARDNLNMKWGRDKEVTAQSAYEVESGNFVQPTGFWIHWDHDWLGASPDGLIGDDGLAEFKCPGKLPEWIPAHHEIQVRVQMAVADRMWCDYYAWTPEGYFLTRVPREMTEEVRIIKRLREFHEKHVRTKTAPPRRRPVPDGVGATG
jgi:putative phage-type endonuclease